eukprot:GHRQ01011918.1.p4 GENE.GHRQ01011918.1~~GHRQ01011918.1.p4  ORF type:complete len:100 (-),score=29.00 GHRQ01011918.1:481-780(-)
MLRAMASTSSNAKINVPPAASVMSVVFTVLVTASTVSGETGATVLKNTNVLALHRREYTLQSTMPGRYRHTDSTAGHGTRAATFQMDLQVTCKLLELAA